MKVENYCQIEENQIRMVVPKTLRPPKEEGNLVYEEFKVKNSSLTPFGNHFLWDTFFSPLLGAQSWWNAWAKFPN